MADDNTADTNDIDLQASGDGDLSAQGCNVFLSHNSQDKETVRQLAYALKDRGIEVWLDEWELVPGQPWQEALEAAIETTQSAAILIGKDGLGPWESPEMRACLAKFVERRLPVIPVLLPGAGKKPKLPLFLQAFTWVDLREGLTSHGLDRLVWGITHKKTGSGVPAHKKSGWPRQWLRSRIAISILTGVSTTIVILLVRLLGLLQPMELSIYDHLLRIRPPEFYEDHLTIIEATAGDRKAQQNRNEFGRGIISDQTLKKILKILRKEEFKPAVIVLDLYRDFDENEALIEDFKKIQNDPELDIFVACEFPNEKPESGADPPLETILPAKYVGFSNFVLDEDEVLRRQIIELTPDSKNRCKIRKSLSFQVALRYLEKQINKQFIDSDLWTSEGHLKLNGNLLERISSFAFGGYQYVDASGVQFMLNYRAPAKDLREMKRQPFNLETLRNQEVPPEYLKGKIVLIGVTDETEARDYFQTPYGRMAGVSIHAHMINQLISVASGQRALIWVWSQWGEAGWILLWGIVGSLIGTYIKSLRFTIILLGIGFAIIYGIAAVTMITVVGWIPILPPTLALVSSGATVRYHHKLISYT